MKPAVKTARKVFSQWGAVVFLTVLCASGAQTESPSLLLRIKAHAPSFLYGTGSATRTGDLKKQGGDNIRWKGPASMDWNVEVEESGEYAVRFSYASVEGAYGQELQIRSGDTSLIHELAITKGVFGQGFMAYEMVPIEGVLKLANGKQTVTLSIPNAPSGMHVMDFRSLELTPVAAKSIVEADRQEARQARASAEWLPRAGYGLMFHWTSQSIGKDGITKPYAQAVSDFPLDEFVQMVESTGARYVMFTIGHAEPYCPAPLKTWEYHHPGKTTQRDLIAEMADALNAKDIKLMCYFPVHVVGNYPRSSGTEFTRIMSEVLKEFGERYKEKVVGYWFDGFYQCFEKYPDFSFRDFFKVCKSGNPDRIIALNSWIYPNVTEWQEYWAGETASPVVMPVNGTNERGPGQGLRYQALLIMEPYWVQEKVQMPDPRFTSNELHDYISGCMKNGGAVTINLGIYQDGSVDPKAVKVLEKVHELLANSAKAR